MLFLRIDTTDSLECFIWEGGMERGKEGGWILYILGTSNPIHPSTSACSPMGSLMVQLIHFATLLLTTSAPSSPASFLGRRPSPTSLAKATEGCSPKQPCTVCAP